MGLRFGKHRCLEPRGWALAMAGARKLLRVESSQWGEVRRSLHARVSSDKSHYGFLPARKQRHDSQKTKNKNAVFQWCTAYGDCGFHARNFILQGS